MTFSILLIGIVSYLVFGLFCAFGFSIMAIRAKLYEDAFFRDIEAGERRAALDSELGT